MLDESDPFIQTHLPCECGSSQGLSIRADNTGYCFSCGKSFIFEPEDIPKEPEFKRVERRHMDIRLQPLESRGISIDSCRKFNYGISTYNGEVVQVATYGEAFKIRTKDKSFSWVGKKPKELFGQQVWKTGGSSITITEGEIDALSVYEACGDLSPVVSLADGASSARKACEANFDFLNSFNKINLCFDGDKPGQDAIEKVLGLFPLGKLQLVELPEKDANEVLKKHGSKILKDCIKAAKPYRPDGIVDAASLWDVVETPVPVGLDYPWETFTDWTFGARKREMVILGGGTGVGKTTFFKEWLLDMMLTHNKKVGVLFLEESNRDTILQLMSKVAEKPIHLDNECATDKEKRTAFDKVTSGSLLSLYDGFGAIDFPTIRDRIRYMVAVEGCEYIYLDHLTALTDGVSDSDVNQKVRNIASTLAQMTREMNFGLYAISHLRKATGTPHEEGGRVHLDDLLGASAFKQWASFVLGIERNQQAEEPGERNRVYLRSLKDRLTGQSVGNVLTLEYNASTCRLNPVDEFQPVYEQAREDF